jgi:hypothetical protein
VLDIRAALIPPQPAQAAPRGSSRSINPIGFTPKQAIKFDGRHAIGLVVIDWINLTGDKPEFVHCSYCLKERPGAVVDINDRQFHKDACRLGKSACGSLQNLTLEPLRVDLDEGRPLRGS